CKVRIITLLKGSTMLKSKYFAFKRMSSVDYIKFLPGRAAQCRIQHGSVRKSKGLCHRRCAPTLLSTPRHWKSPPNHSPICKALEAAWQVQGRRPRGEDCFKRLEL